MLQASIFFITRKGSDLCWQSHFAPPPRTKLFPGQRTPRPIEEMIHEVEDIKYTQTDSVLEAVILEAIYIKKYQPKYNVLGKDDKKLELYRHHQRRVSED